MVRRAIGLSVKLPEGGRSEEPRSAGTEEFLTEFTSIATKDGQSLVVGVQQKQDTSYI